MSIGKNYDESMGWIVPLVMVRKEKQKINSRLVLTLLHRETVRVDPAIPRSSSAALAHKYFTGKPQNHRALALALIKRPYTATNAIQAPTPPPRS